MIHGKLPNGTIWWLSKDGLKIWIESRDLEFEKFTKKAYNMQYDRMYKEKVGEVGELTSSRLESRKWKKAWVIKLGTMVDVYPILAEEINRQTIEEKKKKKTVTKPTRKWVKPNSIVNNIADKNPKMEVVEHKTEVIESKQELIDTIDTIGSSDTIGSTETTENTIENKVVKEFKKEPKKDFFDINRPYVKLLNDEVNKNGKLTITYKNLKEKMGEEFVTMSDLRIQYGLKKVLSSIGINVYPGVLQRESALIMEKVYTSETTKEDI